MWYETTIDGRWLQAKIYNEGSQFGINGGRVSKLGICKPGMKFAGWNTVDYNYDRGLDFDHLPDGVLDKILAELEALPPLY